MLYLQVSLFFGVQESVSGLCAVCLSMHCVDRSAFCWSLYR